MAAVIVVGGDPQAGLAAEVRHLGWEGNALVTREASGSRDGMGSIGLFDPSMAVVLNEAFG